jgi:hypothetical protein
MNENAENLEVSFSEEIKQKSVASRPQILAKFLRSLSKN